MVFPNELEGEAEEATEVVDVDRNAGSHDPAEPETATEEVNIEEELDAETAPPRIAPDPGQPSRKQMAEHRIIHSPYRIWCKFCVMGRGRETPHDRSDNRSRTAMIGVDYFFITRGGVKRRSELEQAPDEDGDAALETARKPGEIVKCLLIRCSTSKCVFAQVVPCKGLDKDYYVVDFIVKDLCLLWFSVFCPC